MKLNLPEVSHFNHSLAFCYVTIPAAGQETSEDVHLLYNLSTIISFYYYPHLKAANGFEPQLSFTQAPEIPTTNANQMRLFLMEV